MCVLNVSWGVQDFVIKHFDHVATSDCPEPASFHSKLAFVLELSTGKLQNAKNTAFLTRNPYRLGSFQLGAQNMSKIGSFLENTVFYVIKLNHRVLHNFPGARTLICLFSYSLVLICTKTEELPTGICFREKTIELRTQNAVSYTHLTLPTILLV